MKGQIVCNDILTLCSECRKITDSLSFSDPLRMPRNSSNCVEGKKNACFHDFRNLLIVFDLCFEPLEGAVICSDLGQQIGRIGLF